MAGYGLIQFGVVGNDWQGFKTPSQNGERQLNDGKSKLKRLNWYL